MKRTIISPISKMKHRREKRFISKEVVEEVAERSGGRCEFVWDGVRCNNPACDNHHVLAKSQGGLNTAENLLHACRPCHNYCKDHPKDSIKRGFVIPYKGFKNE